MSILPHKCCSKCGTGKPLSEFHKQSKSPDGFRPECKTCRKQESADYYWRDPESQRAKMLARRKRNPNYMKRYSREPTRCAKCGELKTVDDFYSAASRKHGLDPYCKACLSSKRASIADKSRIYHREHYLRNKDRYAARVKKWVRENPEKVRRIRNRWGSRNRLKMRLFCQRYRSRKAGNEGTYTVNEWIALCDQYDNQCLACGARSPLTADHVIPVSKGGPNDISNIQPLCGICNSSKGSKTIDYRYDKNDSDKT